MEQRLTTWILTIEHGEVCTSEYEKDVTGVFANVEIAKEGAARFMYGAYGIEGPVDWDERSPWRFVYYCECNENVKYSINAYPVIYEPESIVECETIGRFFGRGF